MSSRATFEVITEVLVKIKVWLYVVRRLQHDNGVISLNVCIFNFCLIHSVVFKKGS